MVVSKRVKMLVINEQVNHMRLKFFMEHSEYNTRLKEFELDWAIHERQYMRELAADRCVGSVVSTLDCSWIGEAVGSALIYCPAALGH